MKIAFLGGGNMAGALIGGLIAKGTDPRAISVIEMSPAAREKLGARYPIHLSTAPDAQMPSCSNPLSSRSIVRVGMPHFAASCSGVMVSVAHSLSLAKRASVT